MNTVTLKPIYSTCPECKITRNILVAAICPVCKENLYRADNVKIKKERALRKEKTPIGLRKRYHCKKCNFFGATHRIPTSHRGYCQNCKGIIY